MSTIRLMKLFASGTASAKNLSSSLRCSLHTSSRRQYFIRDAMYTPLSEPFAAIPNREPCWTSCVDTAFDGLTDGANIFVQGGAATPTFLLEALHKYVLEKQLKGIKLFHLFTQGPYPFTQPGCEEYFRPQSLFTGESCREAVNSGTADYYSIFLSQFSQLLKRKIIELDLALISLTPPDKHGFCSLGTSVDVTRSAIQYSKRVIGQVNPNMPVTRGEGSFHFSHAEVLMHGGMPLHEHPPSKPTTEELAIAKIIAEELVEDGATIESGLGTIPQLVYTFLGGHKGLGVHTEMFSDSLVDLVSLGAVTNASKVHRAGKIVTSFVVGTRKTFDFVDNNPFVEMCDIAWACSPVLVAENPKPTAINSCLAIDLAGQIAADSVGSRIISGVGGLVDFIRGAAISVDGKGKAIVATTSRTVDGKPKILPELTRGTGVVLTSAHAQYVVTEYGIAFLFGRNLRQRAHALIQIAHPNDREALEQAAFAALKIMPSPD